MIIDGIDFQLVKKKVKYLRITIKANKIVRVTVPLKMNEDRVMDFLSEKLDWVKKHVNKPMAKELSRCSYNQGDIIYLWGKAYPLQILKGTKNICSYDDSNICLVVKSNDISTKEAMIKKLYRAELIKKAEIYYAEWQTKTGLKAREMFIKDMKTRWGSCNIAAKRIWLSQRLALFPEFCLEYVVLHELLHLAEKNHNKNFYFLLQKFLPDWKKAKARLSGRDGLKR